MPAGKAARPPRAARERVVAGVMSGTSADGLDVALVRIAAPGWGWQLLGFHHARYAARDRRAILAVAEGKATVAELARLDVWLGRRIGEAVLEAARLAGLCPARPDVIASHGQTVFHQGRVATLQVGDAATIAAVAGVPVVSDFRSADIAAGGEGAPLVPWADWRLLTHRRRYRVALNLGGIANLTLLPPRAQPAQVLGFDTGPGNMALDACMQQFSGGRRPFDAWGGLASSGRANAALLRRLLRHPFFRRRPPKSAGREQFGAAYVAEVVGQAPRLAGADVMATLVALTAETVAAGLRGAGPEALAGEVIVSGGGVHNRALMAALQAAAPGCRWLTSDQVGVPAQAKEAIAFALLGEAHLRGEPGNLPSVTGAARAVVLGSFTPAPSASPRR
ncbi:MAG TPA: anhydro-N-acetylmuramic acid kinase [Terriglobales bacterium]|nr:anhydro-N-acetylmuramic acid kinase [Terriglobales bacterium]